MADVLLRRYGPDRVFRGVTAGEVLRGSRDSRVSGGASLPVGGQQFRVPRGVVGLGDYIGMAGQGFQVDGIEPLPPYFTRVELTCRRVAGGFP